MQKHLEKGSVKLFVKEKLKEQKLGDEKAILGSSQTAKNASLHIDFLSEESLIMAMEDTIYLMSMFPHTNLNLPFVP